nr:NADPH oxidase organizer 1a [Nothobranchius furzeri]
MHLQIVSVTVSTSGPVVMETKRYPLSVCLAGVLHKGTSKMYITSVLWSDQTEVVVYRSFLDFKNMHKLLKKVFPSASKLNKSDRILPRFRGIKLKQKKGSNKYLVRLTYLQKYCNELLSCGPRVSQSAELVRFFQAKELELQPEFTKNSIMIMPSDDEIRSNGGHITSGNVTQPFITETYRCVAPYETKDTKNKPLKVAADDKLDVLIKDKGGWWLVETEDKRMAWFPAPYLEKVEDVDEDEMDEIPNRGELYITVKGYKSTKVDEVSVNIGAVVEVLQKSENGWWLVRYNRKTGYIPTMYLKPYRYPHIRMTPPQHSPNSPTSLLIPASNLTHSCSHGNLQRLPPVSSSSFSSDQSDSVRRSRSLNRLSDQPDPQPARRPTPTVIPPKPTPAVRVLPPTITVQVDDEGEDQGSRMQTGGSNGSFEDDSFSDDESGSFYGSSSSFNLSYSYNDDRLRLSRTPPPTANTLLTPTGPSEGKLLPSVSEPNLFNRPTSPKVPPRPRAQEILTRCTTLTRKNLAKTS